MGWEDLAGMVEELAMGSAWELESVSGSEWATESVEGSAGELGGCTLRLRQYLQASVFSLLVIND